MNYLIPEMLETERLILRFVRLEDWEAIHEYYSDIECTKYTTRRPLNENESWQKMAALAGHWHLRKYGSYVLEEKILQRVIGIAGWITQMIGRNLKFNGDWCGSFGAWDMQKKLPEQ